MNKPVSPKIHGAIDYLFSGIQLAAPALLHLNGLATKTYGGMGAGFLALNAFTDTPLGLARKISFKGHQRADAFFLASLGLLSLASFIRKDRKALAFHLGFLALGLTHYMLTDYSAGSR